MAREPVCGIAQILDVPGAGEQAFPERRGRDEQRRLVHPGSDAQAPGPSRGTDARRVPPVLPGADQVDGRPEQRPLGNRPRLQGGGQVGAAEPRDAAPQPHVTGWGVLGLQAAHAVERILDRQVCTLEQQLAGEHGPVELAGGDDAHRGIVPGRAGRTRCYGRDWPATNRCMSAV